VTTRSFAVLVPVKDGAGAKTRLGVAGDAQRAMLMAAFARDAVTAALGCRHAEVFLVGDGTALDGIEVSVLPDEGEGDLNRALARAAVRVAAPDRGVAVLLADLPCLRTTDLDQALGEAIRLGGRAFVADADGTGTTLLAAAPGIGLDPHFGVGSAAAHRESGATAIGARLESLRLDVDTTADLAAALRFGVGGHTARAAADLA
jgi:2-phospho-L-lactate guanylyltransferase